MKNRLIISLAMILFILLAALSIQWTTVKPQNSVEIIFNGCRDWILLDTNSNIGIQASFTLTNHSSRVIYTSETSARIQIRTASGWTNYTGPNGPPHEPDREPLFAHENLWFLRDFPTNEAVWRLHVSVYEPSPTWMRLKLLGLLKLPQRKDYEMSSQEFTNSPTGYQPTNSSTN